MMNSIIMIIDSKNMLRDKSLWIIFFLPGILIALFRFIIPEIENFFPIVNTYRPLIIGFFSILTSTMAGFLMSFIFLDEMDQELFQVFNITPLRLCGLIKYRIFTMIILGFLFSFITIIFSGLIAISVWHAIVAALASCVTAPLLTLVIVGLATNKIEGVTYFKLASVVLVLPIIGLFISSPVKFLFGILPFYWIYLGFEKYTSITVSLLYFTCGTLQLLVILFIVYKLFLRKFSK